MKNGRLEYGEALGCIALPESRRIERLPRGGLRQSPHLRLDRHSYSIPHTHVRCPLILLASPMTVRVIAGTEDIACQVSSYDTGQASSTRVSVRRTP